MNHQMKKPFKPIFISIKSRLIAIFTLSLLLTSLPLSARDRALSENDYQANQGYQECTPIGLGASSAVNETISMSMVKTGLGLSLAIALLAGIIHQSTAAHSDSSNGTSTSTSS